ncbi:MAG: RNA polymerase sigma factor RpoD/SigA [Patescibacteria group bacterium]
MAERVIAEEILARVERRERVETKLQGPTHEKEDHFGILQLDEDHDRLRKLIEIGQEKGIVTTKDIERVYPELESGEEQDEDLMHEVYSALIRAGVLHENEEIITQHTDYESTSPDTDGDILEGVDANDILGLYMKTAGQMPLLTITQEVALSKRIERGRKARERMAEGSTNSQQRDHLRKYIEDGSAASKHLSTANTRLVMSVAKKYMWRGVPFVDLIQEGNIGLIRAAKKYEYRRGYKFSTYATWWIRQAVTRAIADQGRTIRLPVHMGDQINRMLRTSLQLTQRLGRAPKNEEIAEALNVTEEKVEDLWRVVQLPLSLSTPTDEESESELGDFIKDEGAEDPPSEVAQTLLEEEFQEILGEELPYREKKVLQLRYGLIDGVTYTLEEIGNKLGVTRERARQLEGQALRRLKQPANSRKLRDYLKE